MKRILVRITTDIKGIGPELVNTCSRVVEGAWQCSLTQAYVFLTRCCSTSFEIFVINANVASSNPLILPIGRLHVFDKSYDIPDISTSPRPSDSTQSPSPKLAFRRIFVTSLRRDISPYVLADDPTNPENL